MSEFCTADLVAHYRAVARRLRPPPKPEPAPIPLREVKRPWSAPRVIELVTPRDLEERVQAALARLSVLGHRPSLAEILAAVAAVWGVPLEQVCGRDRRQTFVEPRHVAMVIAHRMRGISMAQIGLRLGFDHTTVVCADRKFGALIDAAMSGPHSGRRTEPLFVTGAPE